MWKSALLPEIALSVAESEYSALSHGVRALIPLQRLLAELLTHLKMTSAITAPVVASSIFTDNASALQLANTHRLTNRTRYFHTKFHWFWQYADSLTIMKVDTKDNPADNGSKGNVRVTFVHLRKMTNGW